MFQIPPKIEYVIEKLTKNGFQAYIVGGCVRDILLLKTPHDYDVTTSATPEEIISVFERTVPTGIKHGTVTVLIDNEPIEVTTFRTDGKYSDSRRPDSVRFVRNLKDDLSRRDFTVNAMAYNHNNGLCDLFEGQEDLKNNTLRAVGDPETRFNEDALRILRLFRFASTLNFKIEEKTFTAAIKCAPLLKNISIERVMAELKTAITGDNFVVIKPLIDCGGLKFIGIDTCPDFDLINAHRQSPNLCLYLLLSGKIKVDLKLSNKEKAYIEGLNKIVDMPTTTKADIKRCLAATNQEITRDFLRLRNSDFSILNEILENKEPYLIGHLKITGNDLIEKGIKGEKIGEILSHLQQKVIDDPTFNTKAKLLNEIK
ncbi:MAG: CCA tRNA nucleotidyltransferase [Clostridia bacterium]|nr:CCA tRNA nucleotidyltransferase [Clostridia bacterium]